MGTEKGEMGTEKGEMGTIVDVDMGSSAPIPFSPW
jgi:hypothetical protein